MAAYTAWRGKIEIKLSGFPVPVDIALTPRTSGLKLKGFNLMSPDGKPVNQRYVTDDESWSGSQGECSKGIDGQLVAADVIASITESERSSYVEPDSFAPLDTVDFSLATGSYAVTANDDSATKQLSILWNGLRFGRLAYVTRIVMRAGSIDKLVVIYGDERGLWAATLPLPEEIKPVEFELEANDEVGAMFAEAIGNEYEVKPFDPAEHPSAIATRRAQLIEQALAGEKIDVPEAPKAKADTPDLMELLEKSLAKPKGKAKPKAKKKVAA